MSRLTLFLVCALLAALCAGPVTAGPSILVDEVHGQPCLEDLVDLWPDCQITALTPADFPIETVLASGTLSVSDSTFTFSVPAGADLLYGWFDCPEGTFQFPFITLRGPDGGLVSGHYRGGFHVESPEPGEYELVYSTWDMMTVPFVIGTGPEFFTMDLLADYKVLFRLHDNVMMMFEGELPEYSPQEESVAAAHAGLGGGNLLVRDPLVEIAMKPIIDLTAPVDLTCDVSVNLSGRLTYAEPACRTERCEDGLTAIWDAVAVNTGSVTRLLYEAALSPPHHQLQVATAGGGLRLRNHTDEPLSELFLVRRLAADTWQLVAAGDLPPRAESVAPGSRHLDRAETALALQRALTAGGLRAGLSLAQMTDFQGHYRWVDRILDEAEGSGRWTAFYRVGTVSCDRILPLATLPVASERVRTLWFWVTEIPDGLTGTETWPTVPTMVPLAATESAASPLTLHEYGVVHQCYPTFEPRADKDLDWMGWTFHDGAYLIDEYDNDGSPDLPYFYTPGGHPDAVMLLDGLGYLGGTYAGVVFAPDDEQIATGGVYAYTDDLMFAPGSFPPVVVAKNVGQGRVAAVHSRGMLTSDWSYNRTFMRRLLGYVSGTLTDAPDEVPSAEIVSLDARPNPFNPRTEIVFAVTVGGPVRVAVYDAAGRRVAELYRGVVAAGEHRLVWEGRGDGGRTLAAGVYLVRLKTTTGARSCKVTLVE